MGVGYECGDGGRRRWQASVMRVVAGLCCW